ncbi:MAG TPA: 50S ribosomal protein L10 [Atopostipes sp.]|nr:50S ribosomal protein L10 [Atopostipes sp.]
MSREQLIERKQQEVNELTEKFQNSAAFVVVNYRGLNVAEVTDLRKQLREAGVEMRVVKNTLLRRAAEAAGIEGIEETFVGPTAIAFSEEEVVAPAKIMVEFAEEAEALEVKGGYMEGEVVSIETIESIAKLPSREGLLSMLLSVLQAPVRNTALAFKAVADKKEEEDAA